MSHLAVQVQDYLTRPGVTATALEHKAGLKRGALDSIQREQHPRPDRLGQLLRALEDDTIARRWLTAYLRDSCPLEYLPRLEIILREAETSTTSLRETVTTYSTALPDHSPLAVLASWQRLHEAMQSDATLSRWFIKTVTLILGPA